MTGRYKAYPDYKASGIDWVGDIPASWAVKPTFLVFDPSVTKNTEGQENTVLSLSYGNIVERDVETNFGLLPESFNTYQIVSDEDLILRLTDLQNDKKSLRVGLVKQKGIITSAYLKLRATKSIESRFAYRLLHSYDTTKVFYGMGGGLRQSMKFEDFRRLPILIPPLEEQQKIANFLDHETAKIDTLITKQEKLIELLKEKRQAVISHAVTKGLNPDAPMIDSGVEWLGEVPEHWVVSSLRHYAEFIDGDRSSEYPKDSDLVDSGILFLSSKNIVNGGLDLSDAKFITLEKFNRLNRGKALDKDLIVKVRGSTGRIGELAIFEESKYGYSTAFINAQMMIIRTNSHLDEVFLSNASLAYFWMEQLSLGAYGTAQQQLNNEVFSNVKLVVPPFDEQQEINGWLKGKIGTINMLIEKAIQGVELAKERKTALISAAVTGKIDVRDWQQQGVQ